ncbi:MAG: hypothetical protein P8M30_01990 [Planctomycetaceae bacterium]|nr:hypothetical protein [Planctomycetaceae bacterium]
MLHLLASVCPDCEFVAAWFGEVKPSTAGEGKDRTDDLSASVVDFDERHLDILGVEHDQRAAV